VAFKLVVGRILLHFMQMQQAHKDLFHVQNFAKVVVRTEQVERVMKLGFVNLVKNFR
jgi:hypothetical protein